jgi:hypothetical protein
VRAPAAPACPAPELSQKEWRVLGDALVGITFRAPNAYHRKHWNVTVGNPIEATFRAHGFEDLSFTVEGPEGRSPEQLKIARQAGYKDYSECTETIRGHRAVIQSFRGGEIIVRGQSYLGYSIAGGCELRPGRVLTFHGLTSSRQLQEEQLAIIRTLEFIR